MKKALERNIERLCFPHEQFPCLLLPFTERPSTFINVWIVDVVLGALVTSSGSHLNKEAFSVLPSNPHTTDLAQGDSPKCQWPLE